MDIKNTYIVWLVFIYYQLLFAKYFRQGCKIHRVMEYRLAYIVYRIRFIENPI